MEIIHKIGLLVAVGLAIGYVLKGVIPNMRHRLDARYNHVVTMDGRATLGQLKAYEQKLGI